METEQVLRFFDERLFIAVYVVVCVVRFVSYVVFVLFFEWMERENSMAFRSHHARWAD